MRFVSLNIKTALIYTVLAVLTITVVTTLVFENQSDLIVRNTVIESQSAINGIISDINSRALLNQAPADAAPKLATLLKGHSLDHFTLYSETGEVLLASNNKNGSTSTKDFTNINRAIFNRENNNKPFYADYTDAYDTLRRKTIDFYIPFRKPSGTNIVLKIPVHSTSIQTRMRYLYRQVGILIAGMIAIVAGIALLFRKIIISPVQQLSKVSRIVASGDFSTKTTYASNDELGLLSLRFNEMIGSLDEKTRLLKNTICTLESQDLLIQHELDIANRIQGGMLPSLNPQRGIRFASHYGPLHKISGDFFDIIEFPDGRVGILIVDVSGHGIPAALITIMIKFLVAQYGTDYRSAAELLTRLNTELSRVIKTGDYIAAFYMIMEEGNVVRYSSAGNNAALVLDASGAGLYELADEGLFLGLMENPPVRYNEKEAHLKPGDRVILFTDGIIEQRNGEGEMYGEERLHSAILANRGESPDDMLNKILDDARSFSGGAKQNDDITLLIVDITG